MRLTSVHTKTLFFLLDFQLLQYPEMFSQKCLFILLMIIFYEVKADDETMANIKLLESLKKKIMEGKKLDENDLKSNETIKRGDKYKIVVPLKLSTADLNELYEKKANVTPTDGTLPSVLSISFSTISSQKPQKNEKNESKKSENKNETIIDDDKVMTSEEEKPIIRKERAAESDSESDSEEQKLIEQQLQEEELKEMVSKRSKKKHDEEKDDKEGEDEEEGKYAYVKESRVETMRIVKSVPVLREIIKKISLDTGAAVSETVRTTKLGEGRVIENSIPDDNRKSSQQGYQQQTMSQVNSMPYPGTLASSQSMNAINSQGIQTHELPTQTQSLQGVTGINADQLIANGVPGAMVLPQTMTMNRQSLAGHLLGNQAINGLNAQALSGLIGAQTQANPVGQMLGVGAMTADQMMAQGMPAGYQMMGR